MQEPLGQKQAGQDLPRISWPLKPRNQKMKLKSPQPPPDVPDLQHTCSHGDAGCAPDPLGRRLKLPLSLEQHLDLEMNRRSKHNHSNAPHICHHVGPTGLSPKALDASSASIMRLSTLPLVNSITTNTTGVHMDLQDLVVPPRGQEVSMPQPDQNKQYCFLHLKFIRQVFLYVVNSVFHLFYVAKLLWNIDQEL